LKCLDDRPEEEGLAEPLAVADEYTTARQRWAAQCLAQQPALADARLALQKEDNWRARREVLQQS